MASKKALFNIKGMTRDLASSKFSPQFAYENHNLRIVATDSNDTLSLVNEKGNVISTITWDDNTLQEGNYVFGTPIGQEELNNTLVLFTSGEDKEVESITATSETISDLPNDTIPDEDIDSRFEDRIYKFWLDSDKHLHGSRLFRGNLNFSVESPIETLGLYENEELEKVYWVDGRNQPRMINVAAPVSKRASWTVDSFNFINKVSLKEQITITRDAVSSGIFAPGTIQYCFSYYNNYGQQSNIFYTSPLYYTSYKDRGASPEDTVSNSFSITITNPDTSFDYVRVYSILRTSINSTPQTRRVVDLGIPSNGASITFIDTGESGSLIDGTELLYIGGSKILAYTLAQKDNTLFLGNLQVKDNHIDQAIKNALKNGSLTCQRREIDIPDYKGTVYSYENSLDKKSTEIKSFKYLERYRFGIQAQDKTGKWSEPIWINDKDIDVSPRTARTGHIIYTCHNYFVEVTYALNNATAIKYFIDNDYVKVRPVVVFPKASERKVICQGVLNPTVYNVGDRQDNAPFAQASWFFRPNAYMDIEDEKYATAYPASDWSSYAYQIANSYTNTVTPGGTVITPNPFNRGKWAEFRHGYPIPKNTEPNSEIQCISYGHDSIPVPDAYCREESTEEETISTWVSNNKENFFIDQSIVTFNSPELEFKTFIDDSIDISSAKLRIIGYIPITATANDLSIETSTPVNNYTYWQNNTRKYYSETPLGEYTEGIGVVNVSQYGWRGMLSGAFWLDEISNYKDEQGNTDKRPTGFVVYPWHRNGSLNNQVTVGADGYKSALLKHKKQSTLRYSYGSEYLDSPTAIDTSEPVIFDSTEMSMVKIKSPENSGLDDIVYYGNIDKVITWPTTYSLKKDGYPLATTYVQSSLSAHQIASNNVHSSYLGSMSTFTDDTNSSDPVSMKYKSSPHAVLALNYYVSGDKIKECILPTNMYNASDGTVKSANSYVSRGSSPETFGFWDKECIAYDVKQSAINVKPTYGYLWLGELYSDAISDTDRFGGTTEDAFAQNQWIPAGESVSIVNANGTPKSSITVTWTEGDTYYQRYDCLKTYPYTLEDQNSVVDILSFMVETRVNLDGRYDKNRGQNSNLTMTPNVFNLINPVYSQRNNFFNYRGINSNKLILDKFPNIVTWTKTKTLGEEIDTWTNVTLASTLDLDGDKGSVKAIRSFNNNLIAFQDSGISQILYNENVQIASTTGVPIEIANSGKVSGKRYISNHIGCTNKWSICSTPSGLYFLDSLRKDFYLFNGQLNNLSDTLGFHSWMVNNITDASIWNPKDFNSCVTLYDRINGDVFFTTKDTSLAYSEPLQQFSSFYDYENTPYFGTIEDTSIAWHINKDGYYSPWLHRQGDYNKFFGEYKPFWTTVIVNSEFTADKIFNNLEYRADSFDANDNMTYVPNYNFNYLETWNEYQRGISTLKDTKCAPSNLKKKFRIWRANIPRDSVHKLDRMRNPWLYLKLKMQGDNLEANYKTVLHDLVVDYFE